MPTTTVGAVCLSGNGSILRQQSALIVVFIASRNILCGIVVVEVIYGMSHNFEFVSGLSS